MMPMPDELDNAAAATARDFARAVSTRWVTMLGDGVRGIYLLGSVAHGGFSRRYSDIDMALIVEEAMSPALLDALRDGAAKVSADLTAKLSIFWADRRFAAGRFPVLDRLDYLDHAVALVEREYIQPSRPLLAEVRAYLAGAPLANWRADAARFAAASSLDPKNHKSFLRTLLYPARFIYSWTTGRMASNDDAVTFLIRHAPPGLDADPIVQALECRRASADPDRLFPMRAGLPRQVAACVRVISDRST